MYNYINLYFWLQVLQVGVQWVSSENEEQRMSPSVIFTGADLYLFLYLPFLIIFVSSKGENIRSCLMLGFENWLGWCHSNSSSTVDQVTFGGWNMPSAAHHSCFSYLHLATL